MEDKLEKIHKLLEQLWGHYALTAERVAKIRYEGYIEGSQDGYERGKRAGFTEGFAEAKVFPLSNQPKDPLNS